MLKDNQFLKVNIIPRDTILISLITITKMGRQEAYYMIDMVAYRAMYENTRWMYLESIILYLTKKAKNV